MTNRDVPAVVEVLSTKLKRRLIVGSYSTAMETLKTLRSVVSHGRWTTVRSLISTIRQVGIRLVDAQPIELAVGNVVRKVLHSIREEAISLLNEERMHEEEHDKVAVAVHSDSMERFSRQFSTQSSLYDILSDKSKVGGQDYNDLSQTSCHEPIKPIFIQAINDLIDEMENLYSSVSAQALDHIHSNEIIMTYGKSRTVEEFLKTAHRKRKFQVIVPESSPSYSGQELAKSLAKAGIETTLISDASIYAVMSRVNKVILGTHAVLANGGLVAQSGSSMVAAAARYHHIPVVVCTGLYKLSPVQPFDEDMFNLCVSPDPVFRYADKLMSSIDIVNPFFDYIAPEYIDLFVTNTGGHPTSYVYRLLSENYNNEDYQLEDDQVNNGMIPSKTAENFLKPMSALRHNRPASVISTFEESREEGGNN